MTSKDLQPDILVADDDLLFSSRTSAALARLGYRPVTARTAAGLDAALDDPARPRALRAVIVNLSARGFDPVETIRRIKRHEATKGIPILGFCGHRDAARAEAAKAAGCDAVATNGMVSADLGRVLKPLVEPISPPAPA